MTEQYALRPRFRPIRRPNSSLVDRQVFLIHSTMKAYLVTQSPANPERLEVWVPKSMCEVVLDEDSPPWGVITAEESYLDSKEIV